MRAGSGATGEVGVYHVTNSDKLRAEMGNRHIGVFTTIGEASYMRKLKMDGHHWEGMIPNAMEKYFGFTYIITHKVTGKSYIGKKQGYLWNGPVGGFKCTDPMDKWWDPKAWKKNNWEEYTGSSEQLNLEMAIGNVWDYTYEILGYAKNKLALHLSEVGEQVQRDVLEAVDSLGNYKYYNKNIAGMLFRAPFKKEELVVTREKTLENMRNYYLKPDMCISCGVMVAFGNTKCDVCGVVVGSSPFGSPRAHRIGK
jgi:hypothetical protein